MRSILYVLAGLAVIGLSFWSYQENYKNRDALAEVRRLNAEIGRNYQRLGMLRAEWAYLNRPDRLRDLAEMNFERLGLLPLHPDQFGQIDQVTFPPLPELPLFEITDGVDVSTMEASE